MSIHLSSVPHIFWDIFFGMLMSCRPFYAIIILGLQIYLCPDVSSPQNCVKHHPKSTSERTILLNNLILLSMWTCIPGYFDAPNFKVNITLWGQRSISVQHKVNRASMPHKDSFLFGDGLYAVCTMESFMIHDWVCHSTLYSFIIFPLVKFYNCYRQPVFFWWLIMKLCTVHNNYPLQHVFI